MNLLRKHTCKASLLSISHAGQSTGLWRALIQFNRITSSSSSSSWSSSFVTVEACKMLRNAACGFARPLCPVAYSHVRREHRSSSPPPVFSGQDKTVPLIGSCWGCHYEWWPTSQHPIRRVTLLIRHHHNMHSHIHQHYRPDWLGPNE